MSTQKYNPRELLTLAVQIEKNGEAYYLQMAAQAKNPAAKKIFEYLAVAERQHVVDFEMIRDSLGTAADEIPDAYQAVEVEGYLAALADGVVFPNVASLEETTKVAQKIKTDFEAILHAVNFEKDAIIFFGEVLEMLPAGNPDRKAVQELIRQEKIHIARLHTLIAQIKNEREN